MDNEFLDYFFHEVVALMSTMKESSKQIIIGLPDSGKIDKGRVITNAGRLSYCLDIIDLQIKMGTIITNPQFYESSRPILSNPHKLFTRAIKPFQLRHLKSKKRCKIISDDLVSDIEMLEVFSVVPFIVLDNAFKYSFSGEEIIIDMNSIPNGNYRIDIKSFGPYVEENEVTNLFGKTVRGRNAEQLGIEGRGLGLYYLKLVCDVCDVNVSLSSRDAGYQLNGVDYGEFVVTLFV